MILSQGSEISLQKAVEDPLLLKAVVRIEQIGPKEFELIKFLDSADTYIKLGVYNLIYRKEELSFAQNINIKYIVIQPTTDNIVRMTIGFVPWLSI